MTIRYSAATNGFYDTDIHDEIPEDAVEITAERYAELLQAQAEGKQIKPRGDSPAAYVREAATVDPVKARQAAYRLEADPLFMEWQFDQTDATERAWRAKVQEIKDRYPLP